MTGVDRPGPRRSRAERHALGPAGARSARIGDGDIRRAALRVVIGGALGLAAAYGAGHSFGTAIG